MWEGEESEEDVRNGMLNEQKGCMSTEYRGRVRKKPES